jgi:hypothetical protein
MCVNVGLECFARLRACGRGKGKRGEEEWCVGEGGEGNDDEIEDLVGWANQSVHRPGLEHTRAWLCVWNNRTFKHRRALI